MWTEWAPLITPVHQHACAKLGETVVVGGGFTYYPDGDLAETSIIDISDRSDADAAAVNTLRYDFEMVNLHGLVVAFGGWNKADYAGLQDFEVWSPTLRMWAKGLIFVGYEYKYCCI